jgi:hypothetical protein
MTQPKPAPDAQGQLVAILRNLQPAATEEELNQYAAWLQMTNMLGAIGDLPRAQDKGYSTAKHELGRTINKTLELAEEIGKLHSEALRGFEHVDSRGDLHPLMLKRTLLQFAEVAVQAHEHLPNGPSRKGANHKIRNRQVAQYAIKVYETLTGRPAGRSTDPRKDGRPSGPLQRFLSQIFSVLSIKGSADAQLKSLLSSSPHGINALKNRD